MLTDMETQRPQNLNIFVQIGVESNLLVKDWGGESALYKIEFLMRL